MKANMYNYLFNKKMYAHLFKIEKCFIQIIENQIIQDWNSKNWKSRKSERIILIIQIV